MLVDWEVEWMVAGDRAHGGKAHVRVELLGPLRLMVEGRAVDVRGQKRRAVLTLLAMAEGRTVPVDRLVDALWPADVPDSGRQALHSHVFRLRGDLGPAADRLQTRQEGYRLELGSEDLDVTHARSLLATARGTMADDPDAAYAVLRQAHALSRGPMLADLIDIPAIGTAVQGYAQLLRDVTDALIASAIAAGCAAEVVGIATDSLLADPLREPAVLLLMRALAATGRAPEALDVGRAYRSRLAEEAGLDPTPALDELVREIASTEAPARPLGRRPTTRLFGREAEVASLSQLLSSERLVTVVGAGGVGKTRAALEVAHRMDAATVLLLAPVTDQAAIPHALAAALGLTVVHGDTLSACLAVLADRPGVLVVDNCEHVLDASRRLVEAVLSSCPGVGVLATSREPLGLAAEYVYRLAPLALPEPDEDPRGVPSVAVFLDRARRVRPEVTFTPTDLHLIADIVMRLDGIPLAIELAAGRLSSFSVADLHQRLDRSLDLLGSRSGDARHRTLRETVEWSYGLLSADEQRLFRHLSVFADGTDLATAENVAARLGLTNDPATVLARLVDTSMMDAQFGEITRYRMLETLRAFGLDRLAAAGEEEAASEHLLRWAVDLTAWIGASMTTEREPEADAALRRELPNLRAAWRLARRRGSLDDAVAMVTALFDAVAYRDLVEIRDWAEEVAADPALSGHPRQAAALGTAAEAVYHRGEYQRADRLARAGLDLAQGTEVSWYCLMPLSVAALARGAHAEAVEHALAATAAAPAPREGLGVAALATAYAGRLDEARKLNDRGLAEACSPSMRAWGEYVAGEIDSAAGHGDRAERHYERAIELARTSGATFLVGVATVGLLTLRANAGRVHDALRGYRRVIDYFARTGNWTHQWATLRNLANLLRRLGDEEPARLIETAADQAPDAPAIADGSAPRDRVVSAATVPSRTAVLELARTAIDRNLRRG